MTKRVGIYIYPEVEVLDFAGPYEVFNTASRVYARLHPQSPVPFSAKLIAATRDSVLARGGMQIIPDYHIADHPPLDIMIIPGGVIDQEILREDLSQWIRTLLPSAEIIASVCTGSFILAQAGLLENLSATTHWEDLDEFSELFPNVDPKENVRWVEQGKILTSAGISAGIDMSLRIVAKVGGQELAELTARQMDYRWQENPGD